jgi:type II secretion system protein G
LQEELGAQDALSLRKVEREEVMKGVLRWLFGPTFEFAPSDMPENLYAEDESVIDETLWGKILYQGEIIKFLHNAIEWENMIYFLYPYFWSHKNRWEFKKYLDHPDFMHRAFLKSGSARVVLTIRPGFVEPFTALLENGSYFDALNIDHPYVSITKEMENYAKTNYPGIRSANPIDDARPLIFPKQQKAWGDMQVLIELLNAYFQTNAVYPTKLADLQTIVPYDDGTNPPITEVPLQDPWGHDYVYNFPGLYGNYDLVSYGADGAPGGEDENADITNWAEASLIGTWNEYTPTSAMDIRFNEDLPNA